MSAYLISVGFALGGDLRSWHAMLAPGEKAELELVLAWLSKLGWIVAFNLEPSAPCMGATIIEALEARIGRPVVQSVAKCPLLAPRLPPSYLLPLSTFEPAEEGQPVAVAGFLGTDVEVWAVPSFDEELGFTITGHPGLWLPMILPHSAWSLLQGAD